MKRILSLISVITFLLTSVTMVMPVSAEILSENSIDLGKDHSAVIKNDGSLWMWGNNTNGQLGNGTNTGSSIPIKIMDDVKSVSLGQDHSAVIKNDGSLWMWGYNRLGQLGNGTDTNSSTPIKIMDDVKSVSLGGVQSAVIKNDGSLWMWGDNTNGELGYYGPRTQTPKKIMDDVKVVSLGSNHSAAIKNDGSLWMWGSNNIGQRGDGSASTSHSFAPIKIMDNVKMVSLGMSYSAAIKNDGSLWVWGSTELERSLGSDTTAYSFIPIKIMDNVQSVNLGGSLAGKHSAAIKNDGSLWMWGHNDFGQLGNGTNTDSSTPIKIMDDVKSVSLGGNHSAVIKNDGSLWMWGYNYDGQLGNGTNTHSAIPIKIMDVADKSIFTNKKITVTLNGTPIIFDQPPVLHNDRTLVPLRAIFEALDATVDWNNDTQTVTSTKDGKTIILTIGSDIIYVDGTRITLDVPAQLLNGRTLVPVRAIAESFDCNVDWNGSTQTVVITK